ncbi:hypothetical protein GLAREA_03379 [Glarea lozoyensis ATCC 20868]|uniref:DUF427 domain-containing protein n=1 Tax=Glarea lozoyensis (strain ATCC 20868 / MF5171) TaxID=1116229 RepID=S3CVH3_GLAL2|nr:uncharacterized protein GLAREA_03379 [Glarea lozoyensis ATCC 20868]EPE30412.1 hypothetical protein GLAREA_03379 [Glarea lozoyensis ATCC 20868]
MADLLELGKKLVKDGPHKIESTPRRVRGLLGGIYVFDTTRASYVWEHKYYPYFYIPASDFAHKVLEKTHDSNSKEACWLAKLKVPQKTTDRLLGFSSRTNPLDGLIRIEVSALDKWFVEDEQILGPHPKDPYKRIECLPSSREVRVEIDDAIVAISSQNIFLYETMLRPRYYLGETHVNWEFLRESDTTSFCPYKGMANYYDVVVGDKVIKDAVWYYKYPTAESALVAGRLCFYNEKFDVFLDGVKES